MSTAAVPIPEGAQLVPLNQSSSGGTVPIPEGATLQPLQQETGAPTASVSAAPTGVKAWLNSAENDLRYGGDQTILGKILKGMGAPGINRGVSEGAANQVAGPLIGPITTAQGVTETPEHPVMGAIKALGGALQTAGPALAFAAPEAGEVTASLPGKAAGLIPSAKRAGQAFGEVKAAAGKIPLDVTEPGNAALQIQKLAESGGSMPKVVRDFVKRTTDPNKAPLTYEEARDFYSNASRLSVDEFNRLTPVMKRAVGDFRASLGRSIQGAAEEVGQGQKYAGAMKQYRQAMTLEDFKDFLKGQGGKLLLRGAQAAGAGAAAGAGYEGYKALK